MLQETQKEKKSTQQFINTPFSKLNLKDNYRYNSIMRRVALTNTKITNVVKEYIDLGIANDKFLQLLDGKK